MLHLIPALLLMILPTPPAVEAGSRQFGGVDSAAAIFSGATREAIGQVVAAPSTASSALACLTLWLVAAAPCGRPSLDTRLALPKRMPNPPLEAPIPPRNSPLMLQAPPRAGPK